MIPTGYRKREQHLFALQDAQSGAEAAMARLGRLALYVLCVLLFAPTVVISLYRYLDPPVTPLMLLRLAQGETLRYQPVPLSRVSPELIAAVIAAEDNRSARTTVSTPQRCRRSLILGWRAIGRGARAR